MGKLVKTRIFLLAGAALAGACALSLWMLRPGAAEARVLSAAEFAARYVAALPPPDGPVAVYHLGHSLTGRDMPAILAGFGGHGWNSQLGWGASLNAHRLGEVAGLAEENATPAYRPVAQAVASGDYPVLVLTEMQSLEDAISWHDAPAALAFWAREIRAARPDARIYLYETWDALHESGRDAGGPVSGAPVSGIADSDRWLGRIDQDLAALWEARLLRPAMAQEASGTIHVIPGGQVMAAVIRAAEAGEVKGIRGVQDLLSDEIHFNDTGAWLMAVTHYAVIYGRSPLGLPAEVARADGSRFRIDPEAARKMQEITWDIVTSYPPTGVAQAAK